MRINRRWYDIIALITPSLFILTFFTRVNLYPYSSGSTGAYSLPTSVMFVWRGPAWRPMVDFLTGSYETIIWCFSLGYVVLDENYNILFTKFFIVVVDVEAVAWSVLFCRRYRCCFIKDCDLSALVCTEEAWELSALRWPRLGDKLI